jgi:Predicted choloylglycine hydrolase
MEMKGYHIKLEGSSYEVGKQLGGMVLSVPGLADAHALKERVFTEGEEKEACRLFDEFCPGVNEEIQGFADVLKIPEGQAIYYIMSYLRPGCSQVAVVPPLSADGHVLLARNYDFGDKMEEMTLYTTKIKGRYAHIGTSLMLFGRGDGMNEYGLAVSQTSAGLPVGSMEFARKPAIKGLQFWAVIRSVLENCRSVDEAVYLSKQMPIAYNINMMLADRDGNAALVESFNGEKAVKKIGRESEEHFICSTNHVHLPELKKYDPMSMRNSVVRYNLIDDTINGKDTVTKDDLKGLFSRRYPEGLCCHFYDDFFGTLRSMIFDATEGTLNMCFGSPDLNRWHTFNIDGDIQPVYDVRIEKESSPQNFYEMI